MAAVSGGGASATFREVPKVSVPTLPELTLLQEPLPGGAEVAPCQPMECPAGAEGRVNATVADDCAPCLIIV